MKQGFGTKVFAYHTLQTRDHIVKKKPDHKPSSMEGFNTLEKLHLNANAENVTRWDKLQTDSRSSESTFMIPEYRSSVILDSTQ